MSDRFNHTNGMPPARSLEYDKEMQLLRNMEFAHQRKKAAFDELLKYTYNNLDETNNKQPQDKNL